MTIPIDSRVLLVEDSSSALELLAQLVEKIGFTKILKANDGQQALDLIQRADGKDVGLILADWNMPVMTGIELLKAVRALPDYKNTPFIMITADSEMDMIVQAIATGVSSYIVKPVTIDALRGKIESVFESAKNT